jgi:hypothetical protein
MLGRMEARVMHFTRQQDLGILRRLCECCGFRDARALIERYLFKDKCPAYCLRCGYIEDKEPETFSGWCPVCDSDSMRSALVLAGIF